MRRRFTTNKYTATFDINNYLTIEALENDLTVSFMFDIEYGIDGQGWMLLKAGKKTQPINTGQTLSFRGNLTPNSSALGIGKFIIYKSCNLKGNCMSILFGDNAVNNFSLRGKSYAFYRLFQDCTAIKSISSSFLPATTLDSNCYGNMFEYCTSLTTAPELPATTLDNNCYDNMFKGCSKLNYIKMLATDISAFNCLYNWVAGVSSTGTFVKNPAMTTLPTGSSGIPSGWTVVNDGEE